MVMVVYFLDAASPCNERLAWHEGVIRCTVTTVLCASAAATSSTSRTLFNLCYTVFNASEAVSYTHLTLPTKRIV